MTLPVVFYFLVLVRILAFFSMMPLFSQRRLPILWKLAVGALLTLVLSPLLTPRFLTPNPVWLALAVVWEASVGLALGMTMTSAVGAVISAGTLVDLQMGFANASILNPSGEQPEPLTASFLKTLFLLSALIGGWHLLLLRILLESFRWFPTGMIMHRFDTLMDFGLAVAGQFFASVVWLAMPICMALLTAEVCLAFLSRLMPQMNMLIAAAPFRVMAGLLLVTLALPLTLKTMSAIMTKHLSMVGALNV